MLSRSLVLQFKLLFCTVAPVVLGVEAQEATRPNALIYRDPSYVKCEDCAETIGRLLESVPPYFRVSYAGPDDIQVSEATLRDVTLFAFPGGPGELLYITAIWAIVMRLGS